MSYRGGSVVGLGVGVVILVPKLYSKLHVRIPPLRIKILPESNPPMSRILVPVRRLAKDARLKSTLGLLAVMMVMDSCETGSIIIFTLQLHYVY